MALTSRARLTDFIREHYVLFGILLGFALVSIALGPYANFDTQTEYAAASNVIKLGLPYSSPGNLINQPPIGFYVDAVFFEAFGVSYATGVGIITLFGLGCVFLVYKLGKILYGKQTGLLAAGIFALTPWHIILSRSFLIDTQCLLFSLLYLIVGIWAVRKDSLKLFLVAGTLFGVALLTKLFAVFTLIPLAVVYLGAKPKSLKRLLEIFVFFLPALLLFYTWYEGISRLGFFSVLTHNDFSSVSNSTTASPFFLLNFFVENLGPLFLLSVGVSVVLFIWKRKQFAKIFFFDLVCFLTIIGVGAVSMYLVLARGLVVPYVDPIKYDYQLLPEFCLLAASLAPKAYSVAVSMHAEIKRRKLVFALAVVGLVLLAGSVLSNLRILQTLLAQDYLLFRVEGDVGFSFVRLAPTIAQEYLAAVQVLGFVLIIISLLWANRNALSYRERKPESQMKTSESFQ